MGKKRIPEGLFRKMLEYIPMACVDLVVVHRGNVLVILRKREPEKGTWFFPGGRVFKNERLEDAVLRKAREEVGLRVRILRKVGVYETFFEKAPFPGIKTGVHTVQAVFVVEPAEKNPVVRIDSDHSAFRWISRIEEGLHPYLRQVLKDAGVFE